MKQFNTTEQERFFRTHRQPYKGDMIAGVVLSKARAYISDNCLDVGAGSGALMGLFPSDRRIVGIDIAPHHSLVQKGDCADLDFTAGEFGTVFCTDVIEHLSDSDLDKCLSEIHRVLRSDGYGVFTTRNSEDLESNLISCPECGCEFHRTGHCQRFTPDNIRELFEGHGFEIIKIKVLNLGFIANLGWLAKLFYLSGLHRVAAAYQFVSDMFFVVRKKELSKCLKLL